MPGSSPSGSSSASRNATRRLLKELETWRVERKDETGIERLGPLNEADLMEWEAVINGRGVGHGYDGVFLSSNCPLPPVSIANTT